MKINEVTKSTDAILFEELDAVNDGEFETSLLVEIVKSNNGPWSAPMSGADFNAYLDEMVRKNGSAI